MLKQTNELHELTKNQLIEYITDLQHSYNRLGYTSKYISPEKSLINRIHELPFLEKKNEIISDPNKESSIIIRGENFHSCQILLATHKRKVKAILNDFPYNKGNGDFIFNGEVVKKDDPEKSSKWISSVEKRIAIQKDLLTDDGCFIAFIDQSESHNLKNICLSIFGNDNFVSEMIWKTRAGSNGSNNNLSIDHETILIFAKDKSKLTFKGREKDFSVYKNPDNDPRGPWKLGDLKNPHHDKKMLGTLTNPSNGNQYKGYWRVSPKNYEKYIKEGRIVFPKGKKGIPMQKIFKNSLKSEMNPFSSIIDGHLTLHGTKSLQTFFKGRKDFDYPKPPNLIKDILVQILLGPSDIILDCYAGSGTTGQAVLELNKENGSNHKFILLQDNINDVCDKICFPRIKKVIQGVNEKSKGKNYVYPGQGGNVVYYHLKFFKKDFTEKDNFRKYLPNLEGIINCADFSNYSKTQYNNFYTLSSKKNLIVVYEGLNPSELLVFLNSNKDLYHKIIIYNLFLNQEDLNERFGDHVIEGDIINDLLKSANFALTLIK